MNSLSSLIMRVVKGKTMPPEKDLGADEDWSNGVNGGADSQENKDTNQPQPINEDGWTDLRSAWSVSGRTTSGDWSEWMRRFSLELLRCATNNHNNHNNNLVHTL